MYHNFNFNGHDGLHDSIKFRMAHSFQPLKEKQKTNFSALYDTTKHLSLWFNLLVFLVESYWNSRTNMFHFAYPLGKLESRITTHVNPVNINMSVSYIARAPCKY